MDQQYRNQSAGGLARATASGRQAMTKVGLAAFGATIVIAGVAACGGNNPVAAVTGHSSKITQSAVSPLGAHFPGSATADQFVCWDHEVSPPGTPGTASGNVSVDQWELSHLSGKMSGWLADDVQAVQKHGTAKDIEQIFRHCKTKVPVPAGWTSQGPRQSG